MGDNVVAEYCGVVVSDLKPKVKNCKGGSGDEDVQLGKVPPGDLLQ